ncbi:hypothetical protein SLEP1_g5345 [Rubroshorea leprosula]|uniref:SHSP domain-containing protein n=1 Tax=Rubroshorea leprosula TaxID=152421 RepID=A0AAV5HRP2_9ROSI|nr:hypothetical protein SLEP1_g5345 [Rubroshorea leprosula]
MARRQSIAGSIAPIYEDFQPKSEWKEEQGAHLLSVHLPDFSKEQVRVIYVDSTRTVRVQGERPLGTNKWSRFNRTFDVPQNCSTQKLHGKFHEGILTIIIPKQITEPPQPAAVRKQEGPKITPKEKESPSVPAPPPKEPSPSKEPSPIAAPPPKVPSLVTPPASKVPSLATAPPSKKPSPVAAPPPKEPSPVAAPPPPPPPPKVPSPVTAPPSKPAAPAPLPQGESTGKDQETSPAFQTPQKSIREPNGPEQGDTSTRATSKQSTEKEDSQTKDKERKVGAPSNAPHDSKPLKQDETPPPFETRFIQTAKKMKSVAWATMKTALEKREDRHLIVNVGVAVLVLVAVGAYVTYKIRSSAKPKN